MSNNGYTTINLPTPLVEELRVWRIAFCTAYGKAVSYNEMIRGMLDSLEDSEPAVVAEFEKIVKAHPEMLEKMEIREDANKGNSTK